MGCGIGSYLEKREKELAKKAKEEGFNANFNRIKMTSDQGVHFDTQSKDDVFASQLSISTEQPMFRSGKSTITNKKKLQQLDNFLIKYISTIDAQSQVLIVGHTDSSGSALYNQKLSEKRAYFIANRMAHLGLDKKKLFIEGVGENQPLYSNSTQQGREKNRRFDIIDVFNHKEKKSVIGFDKVLLVSQAKKQNITNIMTDKALEVKKAHNTPPKPKPQPTNTIIVKTPPTPSIVKLDRHSLNLQGTQFDTRVSGRLLTQKLGVYQDDSWSLLPKAHASEIPDVIRSCAVSEPKTPSSVKSLAQMQKSPIIKNYLPSMIGNKWFGKAQTENSQKETMIILGPIYVKKDSFQADGSPEIAFYKNYHSKKRKADHRYPLLVETYKGNNAVLYRIYPKNAKDAKFECADFIFSSTGKQQSKHAEIIYNTKNNKYSKIMELQTVLNF